MLTSHGPSLQMNSLVKAAPQGQTRTPISVLCVLATIRARTNVRPTATRDTSATMGLSGECYGQTPPGQGHVPHPPASAHCISKVARHGLSQQNRGSPWGVCSRAAPARASPSTLTALARRPTQGLSDFGSAGLPSVA